MYDYVIVTHIPAFYKVNLYNQLAKKLNIFVIFLAANTNEKRADDFVGLDNACFECKVLYSGNLQERSSSANIRCLKNIFKSLKYKKVLVSGWDLREFWYLIFANRKSKNCLALESTINESKTTGPQGIIKKIFLSRISTVFASGTLHRQLLMRLGYSGDIKITKGVGIINKPSFNKEAKEYHKKILYVGRLSAIKNLERLIQVFNRLEDCSLTIIGVGEQKEYLQKIFLSRISTVFASGTLHRQLLMRLGYSGDIKITKGVGIINKPSFNKEAKEYHKKILYVGRLSAIKNLERLIQVFNRLEDCSLTIIGVGEQKEYLQKISNKNIIFKPAIENKKLKEEFLSHDVFILPSLVEPWGLVVEEAFYFGLPVIISQNCGARDIVNNGINGYWIDPENVDELTSVIQKIDSNKYYELILGVEKFSVNAKDVQQVEAYL